jgi:hypothetical protein
MVSPADRLEPRILSQLFVMVMKIAIKAQNVLIVDVSVNAYGKIQYHKMETAN